ncbi:MAG: hypothetical protein QOC57_1238 [Ilumatobacteraceae bacterium]|jgi:hypothetical protein
MPTAPMDILVTEQFLMVVPWHDPVVDSVGYEVRSQYVELFWLNVLGPTATWILRRLVLGFDRYPLGYELDLAETASALGLAYTTGTANSFMRSLNRCVLFGVSQPTEGGLAVRRRVPPVATRHLMRMPAHLRQAHQDWNLSATRITLAELERARVLAEAMVESGDDPDAVERQLLAIGVLPAAAIEATSLALARGMPPDAA